MKLIMKTHLNILPIALIAFSASNATGFAASEGDENIVSSQMLKCLTPPDGTPSDENNITAVVVLKGGSADFISINFRTTPSPWELTVAPLISNAITECEPYGVISGRVEFAITPRLLNAGSKN